MIKRDVVKSCAVASGEIGAESIGIGFLAAGEKMLPGFMVSAKIAGLAEKNHCSSFWFGARFSVEFDADFSAGCFADFDVGFSADFRAGVLADFGVECSADFSVVAMARARPAGSSIYGAWCQFS